MEITDTISNEMKTWIKSLVMIGQQIFRLRSFLIAKLYWDC